MSDTKKLGLRVSELGEPFARALAVFMREVSRIRGRRDDDPTSARERFLGAPKPFEELPPSLRRRFEEQVAADEAAAAAGTLEMMEFTADSPAEAAGKRLRRILKEKGISQKRLAEMLGVTPAVVSRVLKEPDRSKVATLRRIADAIGVELREIV